MFTKNVTGGIFMGLLGRNEKCHCGSGKKYKKCCIHSDSKNINSNNNNKNNLPVGSEFELGTSTHNPTLGVRELAFAQIEQIIKWLSKKHIPVNNIKSNATCLYELSTSENILDYYVYLNTMSLSNNKNTKSDQILKIVSETARNYPSLTNNELTLLRHISKSTLMEFYNLEDTATADYSAMKIMNEFCYQALHEGIPDNKSIGIIKLYVDSNGEEEKLVNWDLNLSDKENVVSEPSDFVFIDWKALDELNDEYRKLAHSFHGLEESSKDDLATVFYQEKSLPYKSKEIISYSGLVMIYSGILERELKLLIELNEKKKIKNMTMQKMIIYIVENEIPYISDEFSDLFLKLEEIRKIRNLAAHGNKISDQEFKFVKNFCINQQFFQSISWSKVYYEDIEDDTEDSFNLLF